MSLEFRVYRDRNIWSLDGSEPSGSFPRRLLCEIVSVPFSEHCAVYNSRVFKC